MTPASWQAVSPYLDEILGIPAPERTAWLDSLRMKDAALANAVEMLIREHEELRGEQFLETPCLPSHLTV